jgi:predicted nucleic acid-binding protein
MMLLDTVVLSELRKSKPSRAVLAHLTAQKTEHLFLSVMTIAEIESGIERQRKSTSLAQQAFAQELQTWLTALELAYAPRILPITVPIAKTFGRLSAQLGNQSVDLLIAATALHHNLTVVTRNVSDFTPTGARVFNPFGAS